MIVNFIQKNDISVPLFVASGCLAGLNCRYDGGSNPCKLVVELFRQGKVIAICPENLSGLPVPRAPCEQVRNKIISRDGDDLTAAFERGVALAMAKALESGCRQAILKSRSPSCGYGQIYDGSFSRKLCAGNGLWAQKLHEAGFKIFTEENLPPSLCS